MVKKNGADPQQVKEAADDVRADLRELGREIYKQADAARKDVVRQLYDAADNVRKRAQNAEGDARHSADRIARNLEYTANYLNTRTVDQAQELTEEAANNVWQSVALAFIVGLIIGLFLSRRD